jgi:hypothetical protein
VCYVIAAPNGGVALCVERNEELLVAESYASLERAIERSRSCALHSERLDCRTRGTTNAIATDAAASDSAGTATLPAYSEPDQAGERGSHAALECRRANPSNVRGPSVDTLADYSGRTRPRQMEIPPPRVHAGAESDWRVRMLVRPGLREKGDPVKYTLFIGSSKQRLGVARALQRLLGNVADVTVWDEAPQFEMGNAILDGLIKVGETFDFALLVFGQDDCTMMGSDVVPTVRDNVIFELGLFMGRLGKGRALWVSPSGPKAPHLASDLGGIVHLEIDEPDLTDDAAIEQALVATVDKVRRHIVSLGHRTDRQRRPDAPRAVPRLVAVLAGPLPGGYRLYPQLLLPGESYQRTGCHGGAFRRLFRSGPSLGHRSPRAVRRQIERAHAISPW